MNELWRKNPYLLAHQKKDVQSLESNFIEEEIRSATFSLAKDKALSLEGFPISFYQHHWDIVKGDILQLFRDLFAGTIDLS